VTNPELAECDDSYISPITSVAVFTYFFVLPVVTFLDPPKLNLSPLPDHAGVLFVCTPEELVTVLHSLVLAPSFAPYSP